MISHRDIALALRVRYRLRRRARQARSPSRIQSKMQRESGADDGDGRELNEKKSRRARKGDVEVDAKGELRSRLCIQGSARRWLTAMARNRSG